MTNSFPSTDTGSLGCSDSCSIKDSHLSAWHTVGINVKERERDGTGHSCGQGDHFLPAACSGCFCQCYISQHYTAEHRHHCYQWQTGEGSVCAWASGKLVYVGTLTIHTIPPHSLFLQKKAIPTFPLKACTSRNAGEMWTALGGAQVDSIWVCQNNKWIPYKWVTTNVTMEIQNYLCHTSLEMKAI